MIASASTTTFKQKQQQQKQQQQQQQQQQQHATTRSQVTDIEITRGRHWHSGTDFELFSPQPHSPADIYWNYCGLLPHSSADIQWNYCGLLPQSVSDIYWNYYGLLPHSPVDIYWNGCGILLFIYYYIRFGSLLIPLGISRNFIGYPAGTTNCGINPSLSFHHSAAACGYRGFSTEYRRIQLRCSGTLALTLPSLTLYLIPSPPADIPTFQRISCGYNWLLAQTPQ